MSKYFMHYSPRNRLTVNPVRGFESHRLRQNKGPHLSEQKCSDKWGPFCNRSSLAAIYAMPSDSNI